MKIFDRLLRAKPPKKESKKELSLNDRFYLAQKWIEKYTVNNSGIAIGSCAPDTIYPEVSGYFIPTLLKFGDKKRALNFASYLVKIQNEDGSWSEPEGRIKFTFDTGMVLKGLCAVLDIIKKEGAPESSDKNLTEDVLKEAVIKGADWILSNQRKDGSVSTPDYSMWNLPRGKKVPEAVHIYALLPLLRAGELTGDKKYEKCVQNALSYYLSLEDLTDFTTLSHFSAYIIEGLIEMGEIKRAKRAMDLISLHQRENGAVPAYSNVEYVCTTGVFQYALCWYKLNDIEKAEKAFSYALNMQNKTGGWYGSMGNGADYFPSCEISWAAKFFLDALYESLRLKSPSRVICFQNLTEN